MASGLECAGSTSAACAETITAGEGCRLVLNADDFGWSPGVNEAVHELYEAGILTSTSLMVGAPAAEEATRLARRLPGLAIGLHMALVAAPPVLPRDQVRHLLDHTGDLMTDCVRAGFVYVLHPAARRELRRELAAQFEAFAATGLPWSHVDSHRHLHLVSTFFPAALALAETYRVPGFRVPEDDLRLHAAAAPDDVERHRGTARFFSWLCRPQRSILTRKRFRVVDRCLGLFRTGRLDVEYLCRLVHALPDGIYELHCHPDLGTERGRAEHAALLSPEFSEALAQRGALLTTYPELPLRDVVTGSQHGPHAATRA